MPGIDEHRGRSPGIETAEGHAAGPGEVLQQRPEPVDDRAEDRWAARSGSRWRNGSSAARIIREIRSICATMTSRSSRSGESFGRARSVELGAAGDDVERRPDLVGDARAELAGDGERLGLPQATQQLQRPAGLGVHPLVRVLQPLGHAVERHRHLPQLVAAPDGHRRPRLPRRDPLDALRQVGDRAEHEPLEREPDDQGQQGGEDDPAQQALR